MSRLCILVVGASGMIGEALCQGLSRVGHQVRRGVRRPTQPADVQIDLCAVQNMDWVEVLKGVDVLINAAGIMVESPGQSFEHVHHRGPVAMFQACVQLGVSRVIQISALGAETRSTPYFRSKHQADAALMALPLDWLVLRPGLVCAPEGASTRLLATLASLPVLPVPNIGRAPFRPLALADLVEAVEQAVRPATVARRELALVGGSVHTLAGVLRLYRRSMGLQATHVWSVPAQCMSALAAWGRGRPGRVLDPDRWQMLQKGASASPAATRALLGHHPRPVLGLVAPQAWEVLGFKVQRGWHLRLLRLSLALVWWATALLSAGVYPVDQSLGLLARVGLVDAWALLALYGAAGLDLLLGWASVWRPRRWLWGLQGGLILFYSVVISVCLPEFWLHPFGPILKNLPILAVLVILYGEDRRDASWTI